QKEVASIQTPIQEANQASKLKPQIETSSVNMNNKNIHVISKEKAKRWVNLNDRKPDKHFRIWGARLLKRWKELDLGDCDRPEDLNQCMLLCHDLEQYDPEAVRPPTKEELEDRPEAGPESRTQTLRKGNKSKNLINKEFERLGEIKRHEKSKKDLEFREQEELETAVKKRAIAVHRAKVLKSHPDNGSDIRKILESQRKKFRLILEKEFDKRGQFKFSLYSLIKFLIDDKPGNDNAEKKNSRTDWLRNKQII
ncbi:6976_t:CDS:1, partial [Racocetra fulgida]